MVGSDAGAEGKSIHWPHCFLFEGSLSKKSEDEMVRQHHGLSRSESQQTLGDGGEERSLACCSPWGQRVRHDLATEHQLSKDSVALSWAGRQVQ